MKNTTIQEVITIDAPAAKVWDALTNPQLVPAYLFGATVASDWKKGSAITYSGNYEGKDYKDKGIILEIEPQKKLSHTHWSSLSGKPDTPGNYYTVTYELNPEAGRQTRLTVSQTGNMTEAGAAHSRKNWRMVLEKLKALFQEL